jgi:MFS family permease
LTGENKRRRALQFILMFGVVSALGDITYEGARSVYGPYLGFLGAGAAVIGVVSGLGEFLGYMLRLVSGYVADRTGSYWTITILGYGLLVSVPLLALAGNWQVAVVFILLERVGKAIRSPAKDALLSHATKQVGTGLGFGIHEALDQVGAIIGPLMFAAALAMNGGYATGFHWMWIPALLTVAVVIATRIKVPDPASLEEQTGAGLTADKSGPKLSKAFWVYAAFTFVSVLGFANFQLLSYHWQVKGTVDEAMIPALYAAAMAVDALIAPAIGRAYDKKGLIVLAVIPVLSLPIPLLGFGSGLPAAVGASVIWGLCMGGHETIMRAAIADLTPIAGRGLAYGIFNTLYGAAWFLGSMAMGFMYDISLMYIFFFVVMTQLAALLTFVAFTKNVAGKAVR